MVLLDHIPHNDATNPDENSEASYAPYRMSIYIPDVNCPKCVLQLLYPMTDKSTKCGIQTCFYNPDDTACKGSTSASAPTCSGAPSESLCHTENECFSNCKLLFITISLFTIFTYTFFDQLYGLIYTFIYAHITHIQIIAAQMS